MTNKSNCFNSVVEFSADTYSVRVQFMAIRNEKSALDHGQQDPQDRSLIAPRWTFQEDILYLFRDHLNFNSLSWDIAID